MESSRVYMTCGGLVLIHQLVRQPEKEVTMKKMMGQVQCMTGTGQEPIDKGDEFHP